MFEGLKEKKGREKKERNGKRRRKEGGWNRAIHACASCARKRGWMKWKRRVRVRHACASVVYFESGASAQGTRARALGHKVGTLQAQLSGKCIEGGKIQSTRTRTWRVRVDGRKCLRRAYAPGARTRGLVLCFSKFFMFLHQTKHSKPPNSYQNTIKPYLTY